MHLQAERLGILAPINSNELHTGIKPENPSVSPENSPKNQSAPNRKRSADRRDLSRIPRPSKRH